MSDNLTEGTSGTTIQRPEGFQTPDSSRPKTYAEIRAAREKQRTVITKTKKKDSWVRSLIIAGLIALIIRSFFLEAFRIPTGSMKNTLLVGDYLFVNKLSYFISSPKYIPFTSTQIPYFRIPTGSVHRGDVVVFEYPGDRDLVEPRERKVNYIKRCIGEPGDVIEIKNKQVFVNGKIFPNPPQSRADNDTQQVGYTDPRIFPKGAQWNKDNFGPLRIPKKGDMIPITKDNLEQWEVFIEREGHKVQIGNNDEIEVDGKPTAQYKVERDYLWMMGDNRDDSEDSRFWGFAPVDNVVGNAMFIYWSWYNPPSNSMGDGYDAEEDQKFQIRWGRIGNIIR